MLCDAGPNVGERIAPADVARRPSWLIGQNGHILTGVIGALPCWVIAVICCDDAKVAGLQKLQQIADERIEPFDPRCISCDITAVTMIGVKVHKVCE